MPFYPSKQSYFNAAKAFGASYVPWVGTKRPSGSTTSVSHQDGNNTQIVTKRRTKRKAYTKSFKQRLLKNLPAKHYMTNDNQTQLNAGKHNTIYTCNLSGGIVQGTQDDQRIGDTVHLLAVKINAFFLTVSANSQPVMYRIIVGYSGEEYNVPNTLASGLGSSEIFQNNTGAVWLITSIINPKAFTVLDDRIITLNDLVTGTQLAEQVTYTVQCDTEFPYQAKQSIYGKTRNLYMVVIPCINGGVTGTTTVGFANISTDLVFKDK